MLNSNERMDYIIGYLSAYENKIKAANGRGLFDAAKMFELFAEKVCDLWFCQPFQNLNTFKANYPYVDLVSQDHQLFVQVSTSREILGKIKTTLERISKAKSTQSKDIKKVIFFMLYYGDIERVTDLTGDLQIGNIPFTRKENLITTKDIISKAQTDLDFQIRLFDLLKTDDMSTNDANFRHALSLWRDVGVVDICCLINNEYQIDRSALVNKIKDDNYRFISVQGSAGSGKSAFCKILLQDEALVLYARAERFIEETHLADIWNIEIEQTLTYLNRKRVVIYIDALEFISDCRRTKFELLQELYTIAQRHDNVSVITSCRSSEKGAFIKLETEFKIHSYMIDDISDEELRLIAERYPVIRRMAEMKEYVALVHIPFYIDLILRRAINPEDISDEANLRDYIWNNIICLKDKTANYHLSFNEVAKTVQGIVFDRAKNNVLGVSENKFNGMVLKALISEGVIVGGKYVRLKFDIFEDICFEQYFDDQFQTCKGDYRGFFNNIETIGRCVYRRYQIWISNKLFGPQNRDKFIYKLIHTDTIPAHWNKQTEIGIVKSRYCQSFFEEQGEYLCETGQLWDFANIVNLYAYESQIVYTDEGNLQFSLYPSGNGRPAIIQIIHESGVYRKTQEKIPIVKKLLQDYAKQRNIRVEIAAASCAIASFFIDKLFKEDGEKGFSYLPQEAFPWLTVIYQMPSMAAEWLKTFLKRVSDCYISCNEMEARIASRIIQWTLENTYHQLVAAFPKELCALFGLFWTYTDESQFFTFDNVLSSEKQYGLNQNAEVYSYKFKKAESNPFLFNLFFTRPLEGLDWAIAFINRAISFFAESSHQEVEKVDIYFVETDSIKAFWGNSQMWSSGTEDYPNLPALVGDMVYLLTEALVKSISSFLNHDKILGHQFADSVKNKIYKCANNILLLAIVERIGLRFQKELPGYAIDLASSLKLLYWDVERYLVSIQNPARDMLTNQIFITAGIPKPLGRYERSPKYNATLQQYVIDLQIYGDPGLKEKCFEIIDFLYKNPEIYRERGMDLLQIQKMDIRGAEYKAIDQNRIVIIPKISGQAAEIIRRQEQSDTGDTEFAQKLEGYVEKVESEGIKGDDIYAFIKDIVGSMEQDIMKIKFEPYLVFLITAALKSTDLNEDKKTDLCGIWIDRIKSLFKNGTFLNVTELCPILFQQIHGNVSVEMKNEIKCLILDLILYQGTDGKILKIVDVAKDFLTSEAEVSQALFNTIIMLAKDKMAYIINNVHWPKGYFYRGEELKVIQDRKITSRFAPLKGEKYEDTCWRSKIISKYLLEESHLEIEDYDIKNYDISTLCHIANCGLHINDKPFRRIIQEIISYIIDERHYSKADIELNRACTYEIVSFFQRQMISASAQKAEDVIDFLFMDMDTEKFTPKAIELYHKIFANFLPEFIDAWQNVEWRRICKKKISYLEKKINSIRNEHTRIELYSSLFLSVIGYFPADCTQYKTSYSYEDISFLNEQFSKYGRYHLQEMLQTIYQLQIDKLLPNILISLNVSFHAAKSSPKHFASIINQNYWIIKRIIYGAFVHHSKEIKIDNELTMAFEGILETLVDLSYSDAAVILDEFRLH